MIVKMKRITVVCPHVDRERTLEGLRECGVVHLAAASVMEGKDIEKARHRVDHLGRVLRAIPEVEGAAPSGKSAPAVADAVAELLTRRGKLNESVHALTQEVARLEPFGSFNPKTVRELAARGIHARLYTAAVDEELVMPEGVERLELGRDKKAVYLAAIGKQDFRLAAQEVLLPKRSLNALQAELSAKQELLKAVNTEFSHYAGDRKKLQKLVHEAEDAVHLMAAKTGMGKRGPLAYLRGFCPADDVPQLYEEAAKHGWGIMDEDPRPGEEVPTLLRNPAWVKPIKVVLEFINIAPGYHEVDISTCFLFFFSLFFAMIVGDAGYGVIFLGLTIALWKFVKPTPKLLVSLLGVMSIGTMIWGMITGTYFGLSHYPAVLKTVQIPWLKDENNVMLLCFIIGAVHITIAHAWRAVVFFPSLKALAQVGWICTTWVMFFTANTMVLGQPFPAWGMALLGAGALLIILFMTPFKSIKAEWFNHVMFPLNLISNFVDVVSYVRLFAVGMATFAMASAFNAMGAEMAGGGIVMGIVAACVIFLGHTLNILLAAMGVLVHGIRLNTLEFSGHLGLEWTGRPYKPFVRRAKQVEA